MIEHLTTEIFGIPSYATLQEGSAIADRLTDPASYLATMETIAADPDCATRDDFELAAVRRAFERHTGPVHDSAGELIGRIIVVREITAERDAARLKSELVATVSHELRTPLTGVLGFSELLMHHDLDDDTGRRYLQTIHSEAQRLTALVAVLGRDVADHQAAGGTREAAVGDQRHRLAEPGADDRRGDAQHLAHARAAGGPFVADDEHVAGQIAPRATAAVHASSDSKTRAGPAWRVRSVPASLTTLPVGREVAEQRVQRAARLERSAAVSDVAVGSGPRRGLGEGAASTAGASPSSGRRRSARRMTTRRPPTRCRSSAT